MNDRLTARKMLLLAGGLVAAQCATMVPASAQAWVPAKKGGSFDVVYARGTAENHLLSQSVTIVETGETGNSVDLGHEFVNTAFLRLDYGLTDRLAASGDIAYVSSKYNGIPAFQEGSLDDGTYHGTFQDVRAEVRYQLVQTKQFVFTPFAGAVVPTHQYEDNGHAAPGKGLRQIPVGFSLGYMWPRTVHTTYVESRSTYSFLQHDGYDFSRSNAFVEGGTYLTPSLSVRGSAGWERTHGGIDWVTGINTQQEFEVHDAQTSSRYWSAGLGVSFDLGPSAAVSASYSQILSGANVVDTKSFTVTSSWYFGATAPAKMGWMRRQPPRIASFREHETIR